MTAQVGSSVVFRLPLFLIEQKRIIFEVRAKPKNAENNYGALTYCGIWNVLSLFGLAMTQRVSQLLQYYVIRTMYSLSDLYF